MDKRKTLIFYENEAKSEDHQKKMYTMQKGVHKYWNYYLHNTRRKCIEELLKIKKGDSFIEIGCAEGEYLINAEAKGARTSGVDIAVNYLKKVPSKFNRIRADANALPFKDRVFDWVLCSEVLEHLHNPEDAVFEIDRVCKGKALISVPTEEHYYLTFLDKHLQREGHIQRFTINRLEGIIAQTNLKIKKIRAVSVIFNKERRSLFYRQEISPIKLKVLMLLDRILSKVFPYNRRGIQTILLLKKS